MKRSIRVIEAEIKKVQVELSAAERQLEVNPGNRARKCRDAVNILHRQLTLLSLKLERAKAATR